MDQADYLDQLAVDGPLLAEAATVAGLDAAVPTCPDWTVGELVGHIGGVHRGAVAILDGAPTMQSWAYTPDADEDPVQWLLGGNARLIAALRNLPDDATAVTFWPDPRGAATFWARRQAHETAIHRVDAELAAGGRVSPFDPAFAADGIDELLAGMLGRRPRGVPTPQPVELALVATDADEWRVTLSAEAVRSERGPAVDAQTTVRAEAAELYRWLWNRGGEVSVEGDPEVAGLWRHVRVTGGRPPAAEAS
jgi:uncharacterized protein (TIGR03083 family)